MPSPRPAPPPACSVIVPCRGDAAELEHCLEGLARQDTPLRFEVIVVESSSDRR
ncbi:MAG TPA: glycosyltransferase, partial [Gammaproteobacteria bacterium]|nr:glycosyltransferase [Gammaproteobacteria bacterium]